MGSIYKAAFMIQGKLLLYMHKYITHNRRNIHNMRGVHTMLIIMTILFLPILVILECAKRS